MSRRWLLVVGVLAAALVAGVLRSAATDHKWSEAEPTSLVAQTPAWPTDAVSDCTLSTEAVPSWSQAERISPAPALATNIGAESVALAATDAASASLHRTEQTLPPSKRWSPRWFARPPPHLTNDL